MPNNTITKPIGKSAVIQSIQKILYDSLNTKWGIELNGYGEAFLNKKEGVIFPEAFVNGTQNKDYSGNLITGDKSKFFFIPSGIEKPQGNLYSTIIDVCFIVNLKEAKSAITHRATSEVHADVEKILADMQIFGAKIDGFYEGIRNLFAGLDWQPEKVDVQPKHCFKFALRVVYSMTANEC